MNSPRVIVGVLGAKGGVGTTALAANLARCMADRLESDVILLDWVMGRDGGVETILGPHREPAEMGGRVVLVNRWEVSGDPGGPPDGEVDLTTLDTAFPSKGPVIVDGGSTDLPLGLLKQMDRIIMVGTPDIPAVRGLQALFGHLSTQLGASERIALVVNRTNSKDSITPADLQAAVGCPLLVAVPEDAPAVQGSINLGELFMRRAPESGPAKAVERLTDKLLARGPKRILPPRQEQRPAGKSPDHAELRVTLYGRILAKIGPSVRGETSVTRDAVERAARAVLDETPEASCMTREDQQRLIRELATDMVGLGPLETYLADTSVSEIMVNGHRQLFVERMGRLERMKTGFTSDEQVLRVIERIIGPLGRRIDESSPMVDARLPDGSRINAIIPPLSVDGPLLTIRKFASTPWSLADLVRFGTMTDAMARFLKVCIEARKSIVIAGGTGSGKTTLLNALSGCIPDCERIITIEDAAELRLQQEHVARLESRPPNIEGHGAVVIRDLVRNALRMRPDRIIVGEVRGGEALDMLQAMNTGHAGSMSTVHANSTRDALSRLETMVLMAGMELPVRVIREQIVSALDLIVHQERLRDGSRKITAISEVCGLNNGDVLLRDLFTLESEGSETGFTSPGRFVETEATAAFLRELGLPVARNREGAESERGVA